MTQLYYLPELADEIERYIRAAKSEVLLTAYTIDLQFVSAFNAYLRQGGAARVLVCKSQISNPAAKTALKALRDLKMWGTQIRCRKPKASGFSIQHEKTWIFDRAIYFCGSMNATRNSVCYCEEAMMSTRCSATVTKAITHFESIWDSAQRDLEDADLEEKVKPRAAEPAVEEVD